MRAGDDIVVVDREAAGVEVGAPRCLDPTRRRRDGSRCTGVRVEPEQVLRGAAATARRRHAGSSPPPRRRVARRSASTRRRAYAKDRIQFGRPIGMFQAVKHHCANMLVAAELATAAVWDAARGVRRSGRPVRARLRGRRHAPRSPPSTATRSSTSRSTAESASPGSTTGTSSSAVPRRSHRCSTPTPRPRTAARAARSPASRVTTASAPARSRAVPRRRCAPPPRSSPRSTVTHSSRG